VEFLARGFEAFLGVILEPAAQRILITDAPAVLGLARFTELDEKFAFAAIAGAGTPAEQSVLPRALSCWLIRLQRQAPNGTEHRTLACHC